MDKIKDALEGKITTEGFSDSELVEFRKQAKAEADAELTKKQAMITARQDEEKKLEKIKTDREALEKATPPATPTPPAPQDNPVMSQFREEQKQKAEKKFYEKYPTADKTAITDMFKKLDSGKVDADLIYADYEAAFAAVNKDATLKAFDTQNEMEANAARANEAAAGAGSSGPSGGQPKKFSDATQKLAKEAGITPEAAHKVATEGMTRVRP